MRKRAVVVFAVVAAGIVLSGMARGWWVLGHATIAEAAVVNLPDEVPAFFRDGGKQLGCLAGEPDRWKNPKAEHLRNAEAPDHFLDLENFAVKDVQDLPVDRWKAIAKLQELKQAPDKTGMLPWAIMENYDRLSCAFRDYRESPDDPAVRAKCLVYAGVLAHFTGDCVMPLHTTRDYDGRKGADGQLVQKGIHARIDAFPERNGLTAEEMSRGLKPQSIDDVWTYVLRTFKESHDLVDDCYKLDEKGAFEKPTKESRDFILARCRAGTQFTMDLWHAAWLRSAKLPKPF
jgi:hypothetical protein